MKYTIGGKLMFTGNFNDIYISSDKGNTWTNSSNGLANNTDYQCPCEDKGGNLYILSLYNILYKSSNNGNSWAAQNTIPDERVTSICTDNNGWFYKASLMNNTTQSIFISKDNSVTFANFINFTNLIYPPYISGMSMQQDGFFYFSELTYSIDRANGSSTVPISYPTQTMVYELTDMAYPVYLVAKNDRLIYATYSAIYY